MTKKDALFNKHSITLKLFSVTILLFLSLITLSFLIQTIFFENFYYKQKEKKLINNVENFKSTFVKDIDNYNAFYDLAYKFEDENNSKIALLSKSGVIKYVTTAGSQDSENKQVINLAISNWSSYQSNYFEVLFEHKTISFNFTNPIVGTNNLVVVSPIVQNNDVQNIIFVVSTLQPLDEASDVMKSYYVYVYIGAIIITIILSFIYAKMVSRPLIDLNNTANKMANLDFSTKCNVNSSDEIGNLASSLNFLSDELDTTLSALKSANKKLVLDIEKERKLEKMRKEFVAGVSHELKTPISLIQGYAEALNDGIVDPEDFQYYLEVILDESDKMGKLVNDMLDLSALEYGNFSLKLNEFNLYDLMDNILKKYSNKTSNRKFKFTFDEVVTQLYVLGDILRIEEVITNLIDNAIKYSPENGEVNISISKAEDKLITSIENEGKNISDEELPLIWEKFYRVDKSRNKNSGGTGLGLSIVKNILELHKSTYSINNSKIGVVVSFSLNICLKDESISSKE